MTCASAVVRSLCSSAELGPEISAFGSVVFEPERQVCESREIAVTVRLID